MQQYDLPAPLSGLHVTGVERVDGGLVIAASSPGQGACPACGVTSSARHSRYGRHLQDLPAQGMRVAIRLSVARLQCRNGDCPRQIFAEPLPEVVPPLARRTRRLADTIHLLAHGMGGRPAERVLRQLGMPASDDTALRLLKRRAGARGGATSHRILGIDDWAWSKGQRYGTIIVDLETHKVVDVLPDRSSTSTAAWLQQHAGADIISRDRHGLYAEGARNGAPEARQVADRFHLIQTLREKIERAVGRLDRPVRWQVVASAEAQERRQARREVLKGSFAEVRALYEAGRSATAIMRELGLSRRRVDKWVRLVALPDRNAMAPTPRSPAYFESHLARRWTEGCKSVRQLHVEIQQLGYTGCYTHLARFVACWRRTWTEKISQPEPVVAAPRPLPCDPASGRRMSPQIAAALCIKPRGQLTERQVAAVDTLKAEVPGFTAMRQLAMRFRGILRGRDAGGLERWLKDAQDSGIYAMQRFVRTLRSDLDAVRNAVIEPWSNGVTEGQISRLKTLKRAMYGRAGCELLRARMLPL